MNLQILENYGLNRNDITIYEALLSLGSSKTGPIIKQTNISSSRVYESLRNLINRSLVSYQVKNNIKYYSAEPLDQLIASAKDNTLKLEELTEEIGHFPISNLSRNEVNVYEGKHGFRMAFTQHTEALEPNEVVAIIAFSSRSGQHQELRSFLSSMERIMNTKKCRSQTLRDAKSKDVLGKIQMTKIHETRFLPSGYFSPTAVNISKREVLLSVWGEKPIVFSMRNPTIVESFRHNFEFLWNNAK